MDYTSPLRWSTLVQILCLKPIDEFTQGLFTNSGVALRNAYLGCWRLDIIAINKGLTCILKYSIAYFEVWYYYICKLSIKHYFRTKKKESWIAFFCSCVKSPIVPYWMVKNVLYDWRKMAQGSCFSFQRDSGAYLKAASWKMYVMVIGQCLANQNGEKCLHQLFIAKGMAQVV